MTIQVKTDPKRFITARFCWLTKYCVISRRNFKNTGTYVLLTFLGSPKLSLAFFIKVVIFWATFTTFFTCCSNSLRRDLMDIEIPEIFNTQVENKQSPVFQCKNVWTNLKCSTASVALLNMFLFLKHSGRKLKYFSSKQGKHHRKLRVHV